MPSDRSQKLAMLRAALMLPLTDPEAHLLRTVAHHYALGSEQVWASENEEKAPALLALFAKCRDMLFV